MKKINSQPLKHLFFAVNRQIPIETLFNSTSVAEGELLAWFRGYVHYTYSPFPTISYVAMNVSSQSKTCKLKSRIFKIPRGKSTLRYYYIGTVKVNLSLASYRQ